MRAVFLVVGAVATASFAPLSASAFDAHRVEPSVYKIYTFLPEKGDQFSIASGSGFLVSGKRFVVTNFHVVEGGARFYIAFRDGRDSKLVEARRADSRPSVDLALLETREDLPGEPLTLGEYDPEKLDEVIAIGYPAAANLNKDLVPMSDARGIQLTDLESTVTTGIVSRMTFTNLKISETQTLSARTVQHNSAINPGNSGGPLFDACGRVVGVNTLQGANSQGLFFSIHASEIGRFLREGEIPFSSTARPCTGGATDLLPLFVGLSATLALGALLFMVRNRGGGGTSAFAGALPKALEHLTIARSKAKTPPSPPVLQGVAAGAVPVLRPIEGGPPIRLDEAGRALTIGRGPGADLLIAGDTVSKVHARLVYDRSSRRLGVTDLNSSNGTYVDGVRITEREAASGALLRFGTAEYVLAFDVPSGSPGHAGGTAWILSGFDPAGRALQFELRPLRDAASGRERPATWTFGRDPGRANFVIDDGSVSALHAQITYDPGKALMLRDMGSMNGTRLDGESIATTPVALRDTGQEIAFGLATLRLSRSIG